MSTKTAPQPAETQESENTLAEEQPFYVAEDIKPALDELTQGDLDLVNQWVGLGLMGGMFYLQSRANIWNAHSALSRINTGRLITDPFYYQEVRDAHKLGGKLINEKGRYHMDPDQIRRQTYALVVAKRVHKEINKRETNIRIQNAATIYGVNQQELVKFLGLSGNKDDQKAFQQWQKDHPGADLNDAIRWKATNLSLAQKTGMSVADIEKLDPKSREKLVKQHQQDLEAKKKTYEEKCKTSRKEALESMGKEGIFKRAHEVEEKILNDKNIQVSPKLANQYNEHIFQGKPLLIAPTPPPTPTPPPVPSKPPPLKPLVKITNALRSQVNKLLTPFRAISQALNSVKQTIRSAITRTVGKIITPVIKAVGNTIIKGAAKLLARTGLRQLVGSIVPVIGNGVMLVVGGINDAIAAITGIDIEGILLNLVKILFMVTVGVILVIILFIVLGIVVAATKLLPNPYGNPPDVNLSVIDNKKYSWDIFEKEFLLSGFNKTIDLTGQENNGQISWENFEKDNLVFKELYLSLNSDGHNDVQKR